ncbi:MAG: radical SAM protein [Methanothrix sp.]|uniref:radical SAM/SPASM domain-containing protein n=1 Tax=Methanothrix sp. TaxID=90426 RepID=UPI0025E7DA86|nr:radical SAM protein [Methanothrix sp.]MCK9405383.1 radical SAM protein [Methanothrix sp.]
MDWIRIIILSNPILFGGDMYIPKSPLLVGIELTSRCNLQCPHCAADANQVGTSLPFDKVISTIDEAHKIGVKELPLGGGEVLLYEKFFEVCEYALSKGLIVSIATNGILVPKNIDKIKKLKRFNVPFRVGISLDGYTPEMHGYFRPKETFKSAIEAIELLNEAKIPLSVLCVLHKDVIKNIPTFLQFLSSMDISHVRFLSLIPLGRGKNYINEMFTSEELYNMLIEKKKWNKLFGKNIGFHMPWEFLIDSPDKRNPSPCEAGYLRLWINSNGDIYPCPFMANLFIGNIYKDSIRDVWINSPILKELRDPAQLKGTCSTCNYREGCRGGCRGFAQLFKGDFLCTDPYCPIANQKQFE